MIFGKLKKFIKTFDLFSSTVLLKHRDDSSHKTIVGGFFSIAIIVIIFLIFTEMVVQTLNLNNFTLKTNVKKNQIPVQTSVSLDPLDSKFMFGIQILPFNLSDHKRYFDISFTHQVLNYGNVIENQQLQLQQCTKQHWVNYPPLLQAFENLKVKNWLCPPKNLTMDLEGKYTSERFSQYQIKVSTCKNTTNSSRPCHSKQNITRFFKQNKDIMYFTVYFINTIINPSQKQHIQYYLEDENYAIFGPNIGTQNYLLLTDYEITTDNSVWPYSDIVQDSGVLAQNTVVKYSFQHTQNNNKYISFFFAKATNSLIIERAVQKMTELFGFIEGTVVAFITLLILINSYSQFSFQLTLAYDIFKKQKDNNINMGQINNKNECNLTGNYQNTIKQKALDDFKQQMSYKDYIAYTFYKICGMFNNKIQWEEMNFIQESEQEIGKHLDIKNLINRIIFLEHCTQYLIEDYQLQLLQRKRPKTIKQIKKTRQKFMQINDQTKQQGSQATIQARNKAKRNKQVDHVVEEQVNNTNKECLGNMSPEQSPGAKSDGIFFRNQILQFESPNSRKHQKVHQIHNNIVNLQYCQNNILKVNSQQNKRLSRNKIINENINKDFQFNLDNV